MRYFRQVDLRERENDIAFARVHYYFQGTISGCIRTLAMVEMLGNPNTELYRDSYGAVMTAEPLGADDMRVLDYSMILSTIALPPFPESCGEDWKDHFFIGEKMGLDVAWFDGGKHLPEDEDDDYENQDGFEDEPEYIDD